METRTDNEIIAEFMGAKFINDAPDEFPNGYYYWPDGYWNSIQELIYNESWDWLMPVVEKVQQIGPRSTSFLSGLAAPREHVFTIHESYTGEHRLIQCANDSAIKAVYGAVVEFIKWYSNQPQKAS